MAEVRAVQTAYGINRIAIPLILSRRGRKYKISCSSCAGRRCRLRTGGCPTAQEEEAPAAVTTVVGCSEGDRAEVMLLRRGCDVGL
jgi:hypothetical protein